MSTMSREERIEFIAETLADVALTKSSTKFWLAATGKALNAAGKGVRKIAQVVEEVNPAKPKAIAATPEGLLLDATEVLETEANPITEVGKLQEGPAVEGRTAAQGVQAAEDAEALAAKAKAGADGITHRSKYWHADYVDDLSSTQMILGVQTSGKGSTTLGSASKTEAWKAGMAWVGENPKPIYNESNKLIGYSSVDKSKVFRLHYKPRDGMTRANFQEFTPVPQRQNAMAEVKNVHIDILDE